MAKSDLTLTFRVAWWFFAICRAMVVLLRALVWCRVLSPERAIDVAVAVGLFLAPRALSMSGRMRVR